MTLSEVRWSKMRSEKVIWGQVILIFKKKPGISISPNFAWTQSVIFLKFRIWINASADQPDKIWDSECYNFLSGLLFTVLFFRMDCICLEIIVSAANCVQAWFNYVTWHGGDTFLNCHMAIRSHDTPEKNLIGSISIGTLQTGIEHGTRRWNMTIKGHFCDGEGH